MKLYMIQILCFYLLIFASEAVAADLLSLSLRQREDKSEVMLDILVTNVSTSSVRIVSEGFSPAWSVWAWFTWEVDGELAEYFENVAGIPDLRSVWEVPRGGTILWASIPLRSIQCMIRDRTGKKEYRSVIDDFKPLLLRILPSARWKDITVNSGMLKIEAKKTEQDGGIQPATGSDSK
jgi:hypothetical protein